MKSHTSTLQRIGWAIFAIGSIYMFGLGWLQSWQLVPAMNQSGNAAFSSGLFALVWSLSAPLGAFIVLIGAALAARVERRTFWLLMLLLVLFAGWRMAGTTRQMISALFGIGGGLITLFFLGSAWQWIRVRPTLMGADKTGSDLRMVGFVFFVISAWDLCGIFGVGNFVLRPELAARFSVPLSNTIDSASGLMILLVLGWGFSFFGQLISRRVQAIDPAVDKAPQVSAAD
jgi:peptidoglycan/LPS O-acetylase OafA/YrhL